MADTTDAYAEHVARKRATVEPEIDVQPTFTVREANLITDLIAATAKQVATPEQHKILLGASHKIDLAIKRALNGHTI